MYQKGAVTAKIFQNVRERLAQGSIIDADQLDGGSGWIRSRPKEVENSADANLFARCSRIFEGGVHRRGE